jgi:hypothetical protein
MQNKNPDREVRGSLNRESLKVLILGSRVCRVCVVWKNFKSLNFESFGWERVDFHKHALQT